MRSLADHTETNNLNIYLNSTHRVQNFASCACAALGNTNNTISPKYVYELMPKNYINEDVMQSKFEQPSRVMEGHDFK